MDRSDWSRRDFIRTSALGGGMAILPEGVAGALPATAADARIDARSGDDVRWLDDEPPARHEGQCWGQPWPRGTRYSRAGYVLAGDGRTEALQSWPMAWWPDGSIKWTGHALAAGSGIGGPLRVRAGRPAAPAAPVAVRDASDGIEVRVGDTLWRIGRSGEAVIQAATVGGRETLRRVRLVATTQDQPDDQGERAPVLSRHASAIERATVEQDGPLRAVVKVDGHHAGDGAAVLPFSLRLYFHAGSPSVRIVHSLIFDGDPARVFVRGLGLEGEVPMRDQLHDRHLRFAGEKGGLWGEAVRPLTGLRRDPGAAFRRAQVAGEAVPPLSRMQPNVRDELRYIPAWSDFRLRQPNADGFAITKRTGASGGWIDVDTAGRAPGLGYVGGPSGGVAFAMHDFWQRPPVGLDVAGAAGEAARFTIWYHAPDAPAMDLRFYHEEMGMAGYAEQNLGLDVTYEDYEPGWGTSQGIARTTEFRLWALPATPPRERLVEMAAAVARPSRLIAVTDRVHDAGLFGAWTRPQAGGPLRAGIEARASGELDFYIGQIEQRRWYGFWNYGDVMHSYDDDRHVWRYDIGGFAWDNSELSSDLWLWYAFLRSGRGDVFRMAEAMTRHTGEVDVYHTGRFKGLGTRHGVQHWGDSSKQPRVSNAAYRRIYYYLTADERCGDLMHALIDSDHALQTIDIGRKVGARVGDNRPPGGDAAVSAGGPLPPGQIFVQFGTTWAALVAAWLTEWERTRDTRWRDRILTGMRSIGALPKGWLAGGARYELATGRFLGPGDTVSVSHLNGVFGVFEITAELFALLDVPPAYREAWLTYCELYNAPDAEFRSRTGSPGKGRALRQAHSRYTAFAAAHRHDPALARRAWAEFFGPGDRAGRDQARGSRRIEGAAVLKPIDEIADVSTNDAAQWGLTATANLALIGDMLEPR